ncbi:hypothetical protein PAXINDRAFT_22142 [Paxillus involutus ATCC 200175]|uniref:Uncharacterized protein n=1 Tax=Paxillus involutus ATCC 200175 TaxID=664439 RepID=A0A0C9SZJ3_PAXIN|nr:hypothetical protein PAXINDRAFT_22142 [Paxillus involutus ATCC 200175]
MPPKVKHSKSSTVKSFGPATEEGLRTRSASMKTQSGSLYVAIPSGPRPKPRLKRKDPNAVHLTEEEDFQLTFNWAKCTIGKLPDPQPDDAEATPPARSNSLEESQHPSECSKHLEDDDAESAAPDAEDEVEDPPASFQGTKATIDTCKDKSKRTSEHSQHLDDDNADHHAPSTEDEEPPLLFCQAEHHAPIPLCR